MSKKKEIASIESSITECEKLVEDLFKDIIDIEDQHKKKKKELINIKKKIEKLIGQKNKIIEHNSDESDQSDSSDDESDNKSDDESSDNESKSSGISDVDESSDSDDET